MPESISQSGLSKAREPSIITESTPQQAKVHFSNLHLTSEKPESPIIIVCFGKKPLPIKEGFIYGEKAVVFDRISPKMKELSIQAGLLKSIPEEQRPRAVMSLLRKHVQYAYDNVVTLLEKHDPVLAQWITENTGINSSTKLIPLSEIFEKEYGVCRHLSIAYLWLAQQAGLEGTLACSAPLVIRNIKRKDNNQPLFKCVPVGNGLVAHMWDEIRLSNGKWIPVDPSTQLIGDADEGFDMFREANYLMEGAYGYNHECVEGDVVSSVETNPKFLPGAAFADAKIIVKLKPDARKLGKPRTYSQHPRFIGRTSLSISPRENNGMVNLTINSVAS